MPGVHDAGNVHGAVRVPLCSSQVPMVRTSLHIGLLRIDSVHIGDEPRLYRVWHVPRQDIQDRRLQREFRQLLHTMRDGHLLCNEQSDVRNVRRRQLRPAKYSHGQYLRLVSLVVVDVTMLC